MESIIIFVLIAIATSVFQSFTQGNKQQKQRSQVPHVQTEAPRVQPAVKPMNKPNVNNAGPVKKQPPQTTKPKVEKPKAGYQPVMQAEGMQSEGLQSEAAVNAALSDKKFENENTAASILEEITLSDMQRSIVMAEILGKPVTLRNTRK